MSKPQDLAGGDACPEGRGATLESPFHEARAVAPEEHEHGLEDDRTTSRQSTEDDIEKELEEICQEIDTDGNSNTFSNSWTAFRSSMRSRASRKNRECLGSLSSKSRRASILLSSGGAHDFGSFAFDSFEEGQEEDDSDGTDDAHSSVNSVHSDDVPVSNLTPGEKRHIEAWEHRLSREVVFSRYYFPKHWEMKELKTLQEFLVLEDPEHDSYSPLNTAGQETTKKAISSVFFPGDHDPKQVLLKRGPTLCNGAEETELLLFTHAFVLSRIGLDALMEILFTFNSEDPSKLGERFDDIDSDQSGSLDRCELKEYFNSVGMPIGEIALSDIMGRFDKDQGGTICRGEFRDALSFRKPAKKEGKKWTWGVTVGVLDSLRAKVGQALAKKELDFSAYQLSDVEKIESVNVCYSETTEMYAQSSWAELVFAIFIKGNADPLILVCSKPGQRLAWVDAFRTCYVKSTQMKADSGVEFAKSICKQFGWQHQIIRASIFSLVVCNDLTGLRGELSKLGSSPVSYIDDQDEYYGYTALHYAVVLCDMGCAKLLIKHGANVNLLDDNEKSPLDHATQNENKDMIQLLEHHGAKTKASEILFKRAIEEQEQLKRKPTTGGKKMMAKAKAATGALSDAMSAIKERGEKIDRLDNKTSQLQTGASDYAKMAKQMKEKNKKKATFFGM